MLNLLTCESCISDMFIMQYFNMIVNIPFKIGQKGTFGPFYQVIENRKIYVIF